MKIPPAKADAFAKAPDAKIRAVLVYGPDSGLVRERAAALAATVVEDPQDPFRIAELTAGDLKDDPARLADEAAALALTGGRRVVRLREAADALAALFKDFLADPPGDALVVLEGGDLPARSSLRKAFEAADKGAAIACYRDDLRSLSGVIRETLAADSVETTPEAVQYLAANLGGDRQLTRRELEKVILYKGADPAPLTLEEARACVGDSTALSLDDIVFALGSGNLPALERALGRSFQEGAQPVSVLRAAARHFQRLHQVAGATQAGAPLEEALKKLRPPVFWKQKESFQAQCQRWQGAKLATALTRLLEAEMACKRTGAPAQLLTSRALLEIAANAPRR